MSNVIKQLFTTKSIPVAGIKLCLAAAMIGIPVFLMRKDLNLNGLMVYLLGSLFMGISFFIQSFCQLGAAFRASPNKLVAVVLGCLLFGVIQASVGIVIMVFLAFFLFGTLNFTSAVKTVKKIVPYVKESFKLDPTTSRDEPLDAVERHLQTLSHATPQDRAATAKGVAAPVLGTAGIPENITDYASYLENLSKK